MDQTGVQEILTALKLHSAHIDEKLNVMKEHLENRMDEGFSSIETNLNTFRIELSETQETVDYLSLKNAQHEKKLRNPTGQ
ncbi:hypothetical protein ELQ35_20610 [Peribacillus cavernae]|uniref:Uncharacterized protein n=1 Tax=Peribacillus cavernae TaxID=1674310 RepID=A0A3S0VIN6_9BACI|nr:hypothetical protein [Peribacillus cavernae]MDQ0219765.1 hypothetical protein [Peribacillus cavernae]RUQ25181.1 hypothetical protein ELQ35_20610 [Peribacillus cavernae]